MELNKIYNESNIETLKKLADNGRSFIGSEISENQVRFAEEKIEGYLKSHKQEE